MTRDEIFFDMVTGLPNIAKGTSFFANRPFDVAIEPPATVPSPSVCGMVRVKVSGSG